MNFQSLKGQMLGQFELRELLGAGGMGAVYLGYQAALNRSVAVKVLLTHLVNEPGYIERFIREAQIAAALEHPHIIPIIDFGTQRGINYVVMRLLKGGTLAERVRQRQRSSGQLLSLGEINDLLRQIGSALDYAHSQQVIHRDIKPSNIMFDSQGTSFLVDFGIAKPTDAAIQGLTMPGRSMGTVAYMSPEQWRGEEPTPRIDQYAMGLVIYQLLTGHPAFEVSQTSPYALMNKHVNEMPVPVHEVRSDIPQEVTAVIERAIAKDPTARWNTMTEFGKSFERAIRGLSGTSTGFFTFALPKQAQILAELPAGSSVTPTPPPTPPTLTPGLATSTASPSAPSAETIPPGSKSATGSAAASEERTAVGLDMTNPDMAYSGAVPGAAGAGRGRGRAQGLPPTPIPLGVGGADDKPRRASRTGLVVLALALVAMIIGVGVFLVTRPPNQPLSGQDLIGTALAASQTAATADSTMAAIGATQTAVMQVAAVQATQATQVAQALATQNAALTTTAQAMAFVLTNTAQPIALPTDVPTDMPTVKPTVKPTDVPTDAPTTPPPTALPATETPESPTAPPATTVIVTQDATEVPKTPEATEATATPEATTIPETNAPILVLPTFTYTPTSTPIASDTPRATATATPTYTATALPTATPTVTPTLTLTPTVTDTSTPTSTPTNTLDAAIATAFALATQVAGQTQTATLWTATPSPTSTPTATLTATDTPTATPSATATATFSATPTPTATFTVTWTPTPTATFTPSPTPGPSATPTSTNTPAPTPLPAGTRRIDQQGVSQVWVPAGCFVMGTSEAQAASALELGKAYEPGLAAGGFADEQPAHQVCITQGFWIDEFEITNESWQRFFNQGGYRRDEYWSPEGIAWRNANRAHRSPATNCRTQSSAATQPRVCISWYEVEAYARWRGGRVPTEAEWEYAARGPQSLVFPWGSTWDPTLLNFCDSRCDNDWRDKTVSDGYKFTSPVGTYLNGRSWVGAYDMAGNIWEWVADWYDKDYYKASPVNDPTGPATGTLRILRGGSWFPNATFNRSAFRLEAKPEERQSGRGARIITLAVATP